MKTELTQHGQELTQKQQFDLFFRMINEPRNWKKTVLIIEESHFTTFNFASI